MAYNPPGVTVSETVNPVVSPLISTADTVCLIGPAPGGIQKTDQITFSSPELLSSTGTSWTASTGWAAVSGVSNSYTHTSGTGTLTHSYAPSSGTVYQVIYKIAYPGVSTPAGSIGITFGGATVAAALTSAANTYTVAVTATGSGVLTITPTTDFNGTVTVSIKLASPSYVLPSIPNNGRLQSISSVVLAEGQPSGHAANTHYEPFVESGVALTSGSSTFQVASNNNPWQVGQTVIGTGFEDSITVTQAYSSAAIPVVTAGSATSGGSLTAGTYYWVVSAFNAAGETLASTEVSATTSGTTNLTIPLTWSAVTGASKYRVYRTTVSGSYSASSLVVEQTNTSFSDGVASASLTQGSPIGIKPDAGSAIYYVTSTPTYISTGETFTTSGLGSGYTLTSAATVLSTGTYLSGTGYWVRTAVTSLPSPPFATLSSPTITGQTIVTVTGVAASSNSSLNTITVSDAASTTQSSTNLYVNSSSSGVPTQYTSYNTQPVSTTLSTAINATDTTPKTINVGSTTNWPSTGKLQIDNEVFNFTIGTVTGTITLSGRAQNNTAQAAHSVGATVSLFTNYITPTFSANNANGIAVGDSVYVTYTYTPVDYFRVVELDTMADVEARFGSVFNQNTGRINSPLSFAAQVAFENGVNSLLLQPIFDRDASGSNRIQPINIDDSGAWDATLLALQSTPNINLVVPVIGEGMTLPSFTTPGTPASTSGVSSVHNKVKSYLAAMVQDNQEYIIAVVGRDGTSTGDSTLNSTAMITNANNLRVNHQGQGYDEQMVMVSSTRLQRPVSVSRTSVALEVGGQYAAAAIASMAASRNVSTSLTRKGVSGFSGLLDVRSNKAKNNEAAAGILVIEQVNSVIQVRHALTMDISGSVSSSELSVIRAKHLMIASLKNTVDRQLIGTVVADSSAPLVISTTIASTLETLKNNNDIVDYSDVQARTLTINPTVVDVRFSYRPAFPVNYISINFSIDLSSGNSTLAQANTLQVG